MATYQTYQTVGIREDLADIIYNISPTETPFMSGVAKNKATNTTHQWQTDALADVAANAAVEGDDNFICNSCGFCKRRLTTLKFLLKEFKYQELMML